MLMKSFIGRKMLPEENRGLHKGMENTRNSNYMGKYVRYFKLLFKSL